VDNLHKQWLRLKLIQAGYDEDQVLGMDRPALLDASAEVWLAEERLGKAAEWESVSCR